jgi:hypothetical protein
MVLIYRHSQGAQVTHNALSLVGGDVKSHVAAVVRYATRNDSESEENLTRMTGCFR